MWDIPMNLPFCWNDLISDLKLGIVSFVSETDFTSDLGVALRFELTLNAFLSYFKYSYEKQQKRKNKNKIIIQYYFRKNKKHTLCYEKRKQEPIGPITQLFTFIIFNIEPCELVKGCAACMACITYTHRYCNMAYRFLFAPFPSSTLGKGCVLFF